MPHLNSLNNLKLVNSVLIPKPYSNRFPSKHRYVEDDPGLAGGRWPSAIFAKICIDRIADQILHFLTTHLCNHRPVRIQFDFRDVEFNYCLTELVNQAMNEFWNHLAEESSKYRSSRGVCQKIFYHRAPTFAGFELPRLIADILSSIRAIRIRNDYRIEDPRFRFIVYAPDPSLSPNFGRNRNRSVVDIEAVLKCISALNAANIPMSRITARDEWGSGSFFPVQVSAGILGRSNRTGPNRGSFFPTCSLNQREDGTYDLLGSFPHSYYTEFDFTIACFFDLGSPFEVISLFVGISSSLSLSEFKDEINDVMTPQEYHARISGCTRVSKISLDEIKLQLRDHLLIKTPPTVIVARIWIQKLHDMISWFLLQNFSCFDPLLNLFEGTEEEIRDELGDCIKHLVNQAMNDLWNRLRNIAGRYSLAARDKFFPGEAPTLEDFRLPQFIASILSSIGPLNVNLIPCGYTHLWKEREDRFNITIIYAPDSSENFYEVDVDVLQRFMRALKSLGIPMDTIDQKGTSSGSFFTTCSANDIGDGIYVVLGNFGHYYYKQSDVTIACLFPGSTPFEDIAGFVRFGSSESESLDLSDFQEEMDAESGFKYSCSTQYRSGPIEACFLDPSLSAERMETCLTKWLLHGYP